MGLGVWHIVFTKLIPVNHDAIQPGKPHQCEIIYEMPITPDLNAAVDGALIAIIAKTVIQKGAEGIKRGYSWFTRNLELPHSRREILEDLFWAEGRYYLHPATNYRAAPGQLPAPIGRLGYPHDVEALRAFLALLPQEPEPQLEAVQMTQVGSTDHIIAAGSPKANRISADYVPSLLLSRSEERMQCETVVEKDGIPYWYVEDTTCTPVSVVSKMRGGELDQKTRKTIRYCTGGAPVLWQPRGWGDADMLKRDFLLVSRLPRNNAGASVTIVGGGHGVGTSAMRLALKKLPISVLRDLQEVIGGKPYWQFVVEVTDVEHLGSGSVPKKVKLSTELPPRLIDPKLVLKQ